MYRISDKKAAIKEIQSYLAVISNGDLIVVPSGVYDENTRLAVSDFQKRNGISESGVVNFETFTALHDAYEKETNRRRTSKITDTFIEFPLTPGSRRQEMIHVNEMMNNLLEYYGRGKIHRRGDYFSRETACAVAIMREIYSLPEGTEIDEELYERLTNDHKSIGKFQISE